MTSGAVPGGNQIHAPRMRPSAVFVADGRERKPAHMLIARGRVGAVAVQHLGHAVPRSGNFPFVVFEDRGLAASRLGRVRDGRRSHGRNAATPSWAHPGGSEDRRVGGTAPTKSGSRRDAVGCLHSSRRRQRRARRETRDRQPALSQCHPRRDPNGAAAQPTVEPLYPPAPAPANPHNPSTARARGRNAKS